MGNEEGKFLVTNKRNFLLLQYVLPVLVLLVEEQRVVLYILTRVGRPSAGHREGVCLDWPSADRILV